MANIVILYKGDYFPHLVMCSQVYLYYHHHIPSLSLPLW
jgi:hypothetical protein